MGLRALTYLSLACGMLSLGGCVDILGLGDFSIGGGSSSSGGSSASTNTGANGEGGSGAATSDGGMGVGGNHITGPGVTTGFGGNMDPCANIPDYPTLVVCDAPILYLRFEQDAGDGMHNEVLGVVGDGSYGASSLFVEGVPSIGGTAMSVGSDRCEVPDDGGALTFVPFEPFTIEAWIRADDAGEVGTFGFIGNWDMSNGYSLFAFPGSTELGEAPNAELKRNILPNAIQCASVSSCQQTLSFQEFRHVVGTYDQNMEARLYIDGQLMVNAKLANPLGQSSTPFAVVGPAPSSGQQTVTFDEVAVYPRALSENEVKSHFDCVVGPDCVNVD